MTHQDILRQFYLLVISLVFGSVIAFFYDSVRAVRCGLFKKTHKLLRFLGDCIYGITAGIIGFGILFWENEGELRFYPFLGLSLGYVLYECLIGKYYRYHLTRTLRFFRGKLKAAFQALQRRFQAKRQKLKARRDQERKKRLEKKKEKEESRKKEESKRKEESRGKAESCKKDENRKKGERNRGKKQKEEKDGTEKGRRKKNRKTKGEKAADHRI